MKMTPKDIFGIIIRVAGLFILRLSLWLFYDYTRLYYEIGTYPLSNMKFSNEKFMIWWGIGYLVLGLYLLAGAPHLLRFSYREPVSEGRELEAEQG